MSIGFGIDIMFICDFFYPCPPIEKNVQLCQPVVLFKLALVLVDGLCLGVRRYIFGHSVSWFSVFASYNGKLS